MRLILVGAIVVIAVAVWINLRLPEKGGRPSLPGRAGRAGDADRDARSGDRPEGISPQSGPRDAEPRFSDERKRDRGRRRARRHGEVLRSCLRVSDFSGRFGGEEFLVLLPATEHEGAVALCEKLRRAIQRIDVPAVEHPALPKQPAWPGAPGRIRASFGIATYPLDALDGDTLLRMADRALYAAKRAGRNRVEVAAPSSATVEEA